MDDVSLFLYRIFSDPVFITFLVVFTGLALGRISYKGFSLGSSGVFFTGLLAGFLGLHASTYITLLGLIIFMYALGLQGGASFFNALSRKGIPYIIIAVSITVSSILFALLTGFLFKMEPGDLLGVFTGSFTNSSGLAILMENGWGDTPLPGYGAVYPLGLLLVILYVQLIPRILKKDLAKDFEEHRDTNGQGEIHLLIRKFLVENAAVLNRTLGDLSFRDATGATLSRVRRRGKIIIPRAETSLKSGDVVLAVGTEEALEKVHRLLGHETHENLEIDPRVEARQIVITNPSLHHVKLDTLGLGQHYHVVITRLWRSGMEIPPSHYCIIELGDTLLAVGKKSNLDRLMRFLGKRERALGEIDLISMSFGIVMGIILGRLSLTLPGIGTLTAGNAGGTLLVGLFLGYVRRFGFLTDAMSPSARMVIKELGLSLFIAGIGASAGTGLIDVHLVEIGRMLLASCIILVLTMTTVFLIAYRALRMDLTKSLACLCGGMVSSIALGSVTSMAKSEEPASTFAACYPLSLFGSILSTQVLAFIVR